MKPLEKNILRYRSIESLIFLYEHERFKEFIITVFRDQPTFGYVNPAGNLRGKKLWEFILKFFIRRNIIDAAEADKIKSLMDYRNTIAHRPETLLVDLNKGAAELIYSEYDYGALREIRRIREKVRINMINQFIVVIRDEESMEDIIKELTNDLESIKKRIWRLLEARIEENKRGEL